MEELSKYKKHLQITDLQVQTFRLRLEKTLGKSIGKVVEQLQTGDVTGIEAAALLGSLQSSLDEAGLAGVLDYVKEIYAEQLNYISDRAAALGLETFSDVDKDVIRSLVAFDENSIAASVNQGVGDITSTLMRSVITGQTIDSSLYEGPIEDIGRNLETDLNTSVLTFERTVTVSKAIDSGLELFIYIGPDDDRTRDFCEAVLTGKDADRFGVDWKGVPIYTLEEIKGMDNEQDTDVLTTCGGWNCRHEFAPIDPERAKELGYDQSED
jgi:hypothetical protein